MSRWRWWIGRLTRRLWVRATLVGALGMLGAILAAVAERFIPWQMPFTIKVEAVDSLLTIIASSMLAVTTFSLSIMVSAFGSATSNVTPRATRLLIEDRLTQTVLAAFIGSFLFSIVGLIVLKTGAYGDRGRVVLFAVTIGVIALVVVSLLRWIDLLTRLGRVGETSDRVEQATRQALQARLREPTLGGTPYLPDARSARDARAVTAEKIGYVQHIDMPALARLSEAHDIDLFVEALPGTFVYPHTALLRVPPGSGLQPDDDLRKAVCNAFTIGNERSFEQDPRFGLAVMSEIASRALSPATNDPGTAIDVIGRTTRLLCLWAQGSEPQLQGEAQFPRVHVPALRAADLLEDAFLLMARDGAALIEVQLRIQKSLRALSRMGNEEFRAAARAQSRLAFNRAQSALAFEGDLERLREAVVE